jgi:dihydrofolate reductase
MRKVILQEFVTIDGFAADQNGGMSFFDSFHGKPRQDLDEDTMRFMDTIDTILLGAVTYRLFLGFWPTATTDMDPIADKLNGTPKTVFSQTLDRAPWGKWAAAKVVKHDAAEEIVRLKEQPGKNMVLWGSISLAQALMKAGLIDEYQLRVCPTILGKGRPLFPNDINSLTLKPSTAKMYDSGLVLLDYQLAGKAGE